MSYIFALVISVIAGICVALEPTVNSALGRYIPARLAALQSSIVGLAIILILNLVSGGFKEYRNILKAPPYLWIGGILGIIIVYSGIKAAPIIGVGTMVTIMVAVQLITSIIVDTFGLFGNVKVPLETGRIIGVLLLIIGARLIIK